MPTVLITGSNRGIGLGLARSFAADGWTVIATCREPDKAEDLKKIPGEVEIHRLDVTDHKAIEALAEKLKGRPIDVLVNNAGVLGSRTFERGGPGQQFGDMDYEGLRHVLEVNTIAPLRMVEAFADHVAASGQKKIVTITSAMGSLSAMEPGHIAYRTSKAAVNAIMRNVAFTLKEKGISVALLHPGWVRTDMGSEEAPVTVEESVKGLREQIGKMHLGWTAPVKNYKGETIPW